MNKRDNVEVDDYARTMYFVDEMLHYSAVPWYKILAIFKTIPYWYYCQLDLNVKRAKSYTYYCYMILYYGCTTSIYSQAPHIDIVTSGKNSWFNSKWHFKACVTVIRACTSCTIPNMINHDIRMKTVIDKCFLTRENIFFS